VGHDLEVHPVTLDRWPDMVDLFERPGPRGAWPRTGACYCMFWRLEPTRYEENFRRRSIEGVTGGPNKNRMHAIVAEGRTPGLLAYREGRPCGWVAVSPRSALVRLSHVPGNLTDDESAHEGAWAISCFYVYRGDWGTGVATSLLEAAVAHAVEHGAVSIEAYPIMAGNIDPYTGYDTMFERAGFRLVQPGRGRGRSLWRRDEVEAEGPGGNLI
jgi:GNAT superfamily N-acetyltransferase